MILNVVKVIDNNIIIYKHFTIFKNCLSIYIMIILDLILHISLKCLQDYF